MTINLIRQIFIGMGHKLMWYNGCIESLLYKSINDAISFTCIVAKFRFLRNINVSKNFS